MSKGRAIQLNDMYSADLLAEYPIEKRMYLIAQSLVNNDNTEVEKMFLLMESVNTEKETIKAEIDAADDSGVAQIDIKGRFDALKK